MRVISTIISNINYTIIAMEAVGTTIQNLDKFKWTYTIHILYIYIYTAHTYVYMYTVLYIVFK